MRKLFLINALILLTLVSCSSFTTAERDQIKNSAILLGESYNSRGLYTQALEVYDQALLEVSDYRLNYNRAATLALLERYDEALEYCRLSFETYPDIISFKKLEFSIYQLNGSKDSAIECAREILTLDPADTETALSLMNLLEGDEAFEVALELFNRGITENAVLTVLYNHDSTAWSEVYNLLYLTEE